MKRRVPSPPRHLVLRLESLRLLSVAGPEPFLGPVQTQSSTAEVCGGSKVGCC